MVDREEEEDVLNTPLSSTVQEAAAKHFDNIHRTMQVHLNDVKADYAEILECFEKMERIILGTNTTAELKKLTEISIDFLGDEEDDVDVDTSCFTIEKGAELSKLEDKVSAKLSYYHDIAAWTIEVGARTGVSGKMRLKTEQMPGQLEVQMTSREGGFFEDVKDLLSFKKLQRQQLENTAGALEGRLIQMQQDVRMWAVYTRQRNQRFQVMALEHNSAAMGLMIIRELNNFRDVRRRILSSVLDMGFRLAQDRVIGQLAESANNISRASVASAQPQAQPRPGGPAQPSPYDED